MSILINELQRYREEVLTEVEHKILEGVKTKIRENPQNVEFVLRLDNAGLSPKNKELNDLLVKRLNEKGISVELTLLNEIEFFKFNVPIPKNFKVYIEEEYEEDDVDVEDLDNDDSEDLELDEDKLRYLFKENSEDIDLLKLDKSAEEVKDEDEKALKNLVTILSRRN